MRMHFRVAKLIFALMMVLSTTVFAENTSNAPQVTLYTDLGEIVIELNPKAAPETVKNYLAYARAYHYDGLIFHRVIDGFMIQTGSYCFDYGRKEPKFDPVVNESSNGLKNRRGSVAMARHDDPDSAQAQFYINLRDNPHLDYSEEQPGYTVFGVVIKGMDVADQIGKVPTHQVNKSLTDAPIEIIQIQRVSVKE